MIYDETEAKKSWWRIAFSSNNPKRIAQAHRRFKRSIGSLPGMWGYDYGR